MTHACNIFVASMIALGGAATPALAQGDGATPRTLPLPWEPETPAVAKSDQYRLVGRVLAIDRQRGTVKLDTDEGVQVVPAPRMTLAAIREGDLISVPRDAGNGANALPRQTPRR